MTGLIIMLVIGILFILFTMILIWYVNIGGIYSSVKEARTARVEKPESNRSVKGVRWRIMTLLKQ
jgi:hypothetical protein